jgi:hypothetical protein
MSPTSPTTDLELFQRVMAGIESREREESPLLPVGEVARRMGVTTMAVRKWERSGWLTPTYRVGKRGDRRYREVDVKALQRRFGLGG